MSSSPSPTQEIFSKEMMQLTVSFRKLIWFTFGESLIVMAVIAFIHLRGNFETTRFETLKLSGKEKKLFVTEYICGI